MVWILAAIAVLLGALALLLAALARGEARGAREAARDADVRLRGLLGQMPSEAAVGEQRARREALERQVGQLEARARAAPPPEAPDLGAFREALTGLERQVQRLEQRLEPRVEQAAAAEVEAVPEAPPVSEVSGGPSAPGEVGAALAALGYETWRIIDRAPEGDGWRVEVERGGVVHKGVIQLPEGRAPRFVAVSSLRAFP